jgi:hypothetical protein
MSELAGILRSFTAPQTEKRESRDQCVVLDYRKVLGRMLTRLLVSRGGLRVSTLRSTALAARAVQRMKMSVTTPPGSVTASPHPNAAAAILRNNKVVGAWLLTTAGAVFFMVVLGGVTRLTRSGLSIVEWKPAGETLPLTEEQWLLEFEKYQKVMSNTRSQTPFCVRARARTHTHTHTHTHTCLLFSQFPEFQRVNKSMTLEEFKPIYWMEWLHRFWGRSIGVLFAAPLAYFAATRRIPAGQWPKLLGLLGLGAAQGGIGWWMVKSGLEHERFDQYSTPRVSPYRLATHVSLSNVDS